jgi:hypothetical protein
VGYLPFGFVIAKALPRITSRRSASWLRIAIVGLALVELAVYAFFANWIFEISAAMAAVVTVVALATRVAANPATVVEWDSCPSCWLFSPRQQRGCVSAHSSGGGMHSSGLQALPQLLRL